MLYVLCNKFGEPKEDTNKVSSVDNKLTNVQDFSLQDREGDPVEGYLLVIDGAVHYAVADSTPSGTYVAPSEPATDDEIHIPADLEEPSSD